MSAINGRLFIRSGKARFQQVRRKRPNPLSMLYEERRTVGLGGLRVGETELLFQGIEFALNNGLTVCIATPRTDVVLELAPRFRQAFPGVEIAALYGGSSDVGNLSPLIISTTHQLLRYKEAFDVIIIDEVDAFRILLITRCNTLLKIGKRQSAHIYLTATPSADMKKG
ncbi:hypothetical protein PO124_29880 [Bacillus licheniformis]|nr:hypothetical protein [Bacillus licheniformis]